MKKNQLDSFLHGQGQILPTSASTIHFVLNQILCSVEAIII